jgi:cell division GTPase FtsZ
MNRRKFVSCLSWLSAADLIAQHLSSFDLNDRPSAEQAGSLSYPANAKRSVNEQLRIGMVGVAGIGVYFLDRVARQLDYPCRTIAIESSIDRLRWSHSEHLFLISSNGAFPAIVTEAQEMARNHGSDISKVISDLDVAFLLTGLNGNVGKGVTRAVAETLRQSGVFTIAIVPGRRESEAVRSLEQVVDVAIEIPYSWQVNAGVQDRLWRERVTGEIAETCRSITISLV